MKVIKRVIAWLSMWDKRVSLNDSLNALACVKDYETRWLIEARICQLQNKLAKARADYLATF